MKPKNIQAMFLFYLPKWGWEGTCPGFARSWYCTMESNFRASSYRVWYNSTCTCRCSEEMKIKARLFMSYPFSQEKESGAEAICLRSHDSPWETLDYSGSLKQTLSWSVYFVLFLSVMNEIVKRCQLLVSSCTYLCVAILKLRPINTCSFMSAHKLLQDYLSLSPQLICKASLQRTCPLEYPKWGLNLTWTPYWLLS